jgi:capsular polysaccharide biosynthesis protein
MDSSPASRHLRPEDFTFYGFDDLQPALAETLAPLQIRSGAPAAVTVENAVYVPTVEVAPHQFEGGLLTADGQPIPEALAQRRKSRWGSRVLGELPPSVALDPERAIDEDVVYLGWYFDHFGHFLLESLARTWILPALDPALPVVFHTQRRSTISGPTLDILELLGVGRDRILTLDPQTRLRRVIVPEPLYEISHAAHERMPEPFRRIAAQLAPRDAPTGQPLYLSRRLLSSRQRAIVGELAMEEVMRENGFLVVHPETMILADQLRLVNRHRDVFTSAGSAAYLPLFAERPSRLHLLTAGIPFQDYFLVPAVGGIDAHYANCFAGGDRLSVHYAPLRVEMDKVAGYLDATGFLKRRLRASLSTRALDLSAAYEEARLYRYLMTEGRTTALPTTIEADALERAPSSWPLSWALAWHFLGQEPERASQFVGQFINLAAKETDVDRLAHFQDDIARGIGQMARQSPPELAERLTTVARDRFQVDPAEARRRQAERRARRGTGTERAPARLAER